MAHTKVTKTYSQNTGVANTFSYSGSFDVFKGTEVVTQLDGVDLTFTASTINESASPREYTVDTAAKTIHIGGADLSSGTILMRPVTDMGAPTPRADYTPGASITSEDLNNNQLQLMRKAMEYDDQKLDTTGDTMTGHLTMGEDTTLIFEGATDDGYETTLTVADPTADRTITLPNVTGTVVTTGDTGTVNATMLAANSVDSSELVDGSIDTSHFSTGAVDSAAIANGTITNDDISSSAGIQFTKFEDLDSAKILVGNGSNKATEVSVSGDITISNTGAVTIENDAVEQAMIADDAVGADQLASDSVVSASIVDGSVTNDDVNAAAAIAHTKIAPIPDGQILVGSGSTVPTAVAVSGDVTLANTGAVTIANDAVEIGMIGCEQTTITDSDSHLPTSGAVVDYVAAQLEPFGGFEVIANRTSFPNTPPASGVVISIKDASGIVFDGTSTPDTTAGNCTEVDGTNVTIQAAPDALQSKTIGAGVGMLVTYSGSGTNYTFHRLLAKDDDVEQLSQDIEDFKARYRVAGSPPSADNDAGDLYFNTGTDKMYVRNAANNSWDEITSTGEFKFLVLTNAGTSNAATYGSAVSYDLKISTVGGTAASVTTAAQLIVSVNGVIQKPNSGTSQPAEGFAMSDVDTIIFSAAPAANSSVFVIQMGSAVTIPTPGDNTVTSDKIVNGAIMNVDVNASAAIAGSKLADDSIGVEKLDIHNAESGTDKYLKYTSNGMEWVTVSTTPEGEAVQSTTNSNEAATKFLRADGDGTCSWQIPPDTNTQLAFANDANNRVITGTGSGGLNGESGLTYDGSTLAVTGKQTISAQPAFRASRTSNVSATSIIIFNSQQFEQGGDNYDPTTGIFTCPVAGVYLFTTHCLKTPVAETGRIEMRKGADAIGRAQASFDNTEYQNLSMSIIQSCAANDEISVWVTMGAVWGSTGGNSQTTQFMGYLLG